ncbi:hypothetical protein [Tritonibacter aquimaris]|uniref:hypothetical protein n=1 Tax=Tritonibacter aquimaris TaxID=2663379 RepID=UPI0018863EF5|nr:hypothetical protein [Tritonibacter aquimaris]
MLKLILMLGAVVALASCGADGEPVRPSYGANIGISNHGVHLGGSVGASKGPVSVAVGF